MYQVPKLADYSQAALDRAAKELLSALEVEATAVTSDAEWKAFRDRWMARKSGILTQVNEVWLKAAPAAAKRETGLRVNEVKKYTRQRVESAWKSTLFHKMPVQEVRGEIKLRPEDSADFDSLMKDYLELELRSERIDVTLPGIPRPMGAEHPILRVMDEMVAVFQSMGYSVAEGPEIETDYYNFEALNFPPNHPARDTQDTLFIAGQEQKPLRERLLLRTHTSPVQIRAMEKQKPPVRVIAPGKVHRHDASDATHSPVFHQIEGLAVDEGLTFCDLKGTLDYFVKAIFGASVKTRFHPSFFPFTEPSADVAISCIFCGGKGCRICKQSGWIELLGCGMVDPAVYGFVDYDAEKVSGFAWGLGVERVAILKYGVDDIQLFFQGDVRFLEQFT